MKWIKTLMVAGTLFLFANSSAQAAYGDTSFSDLRAIGAGVVIVGAAIGIGGLARAAVESMARQPEIAGNINTSMLIAAAMIEGATLFALLIILLQR
jgi:F-type H+-transporting ATPase subunit c